jgi:hypothetical protein
MAVRTALDTWFSESVVLALGFEADGVGDLRIDLRERALQKTVAGCGALFVNGSHLMLLVRRSYLIIKDR